MNYHVVLDLTPEEINMLKHKAIDYGIYIKELVERMVKSYLSRKVDIGIIEEEQN